MHLKWKRERERNLSGECKLVETTADKVHDGCEVLGDGGENVGWGCRELLMQNELIWEKWVRFILTHL